MASTDAVEYATVVWADWFNNRCLLQSTGDGLPAEYEAVYYQNQVQVMAA